MAKVNVEFGANTGGFSSGLARVKNDLASLKKGAENSFSFGGIVKGLATFVGAKAILDGVIGAYKQLAEYADQFRERTAQALQATLALTQVRNGPEARLAAGQKREKSLGDEAQKDAENAKTARDNPLTYDPSFVGDAARFKRDYFEKVANESQSLYQQQIQQNADLKFQLENQTRELSRQVAKEADAQDVRKGRRSLERAATLELERQRKEVARVNYNPQLGSNARVQARLEFAKAQDALQDAQIQTIQAFKADSLARVGGGGSVYTGASADPVTTELKTQTSVLRSIYQAMTSDYKQVTAKFYFKR